MPVYKMDGKKDGKQKYRVRINYQDAVGNPKQIDRVAYGLEEAKALEAKLTYDIKEEAPARSMTVKELINEYLQVKKHDLKESSFDRMKRNIEYYIIPNLGNVNLKRLDIKRLQGFKELLAARDISITTKRNIYSYFRTLLNYAVKVEYLPRNPLDKIGNFKDVQIIKKEMDYYTPDDFRAFMQAAEEFAEKEEKNGCYHEWHYCVFFSLAFFTGLRKGEIHALQWSDIKDGYLSVTRSITQKLKGEDRITPPKNKSSVRVIQLPLPLLDILERHYNRCKELGAFSDSSYVCGITKPLRDSTIQKRNVKYSQAAGLKTIRIHDFRHSHASVLANEGINIQEIARRLGHSKIEVTWQTYSHMYPREEERAIIILNKIVF
jgi:integrase